MKKLMENVEANSLQIQEMVKELIKDSCQSLDDYIDNIKNLFLSDKPIPDSDLDKIILKIPTYIYYLTQYLQALDIRKGVSAETAKFSENEALLSATGTVAEKQAQAENASVNNRIVQQAYKVATSLVQAKVNGAMEILSSAKRIQQRRIEEMRLTKMAGDSVAF